MKITHYVDKTTTEISGDWLSWLSAAGYTIPSEYVDGSILALILIESKNKDAWAMYHPQIGGLDTEYVCIGIPTEDESEELLDLAVQMIEGPLRLLAAASSATKNHA